MHGQAGLRLMSFGSGYLGVALAILFSSGIVRSAIAKPDEAATVVCLDPHFYREQAARFRRLAAADLTSQMMGLAAAYEAKAAHLEAPTGDPCTPFWLSPD
jgi:hypothetical protein